MPGFVESGHASTEVVADEVDRNHTPIISPATRAGASFVKA